MTSIQRGSHRKRWVVGLGVLAILGLAVIMILPRFSATIAKAREGSAKGNYGALVAALDIYYGEHEGRLPERLDDPVFVDKYLGGTEARVDLSQLGHVPSAVIETYPFTDSRGHLDPAKLRDTGHYVYDSRHGTLALDCTHKDSKGRPLYASCSGEPLIEGP